MAVLQGIEDVVCEFLGSPGDIGNAGNRRSASRRDHVMHGRNLASQDGKRRAEHGVQVNDCANLGLLLHDVTVEAPLRRWLAWSLVRSIELHEHNVFRLHLIVGHA